MSLLVSTMFSNCKKLMWLGCMRGIQERLITKLILMYFPQVLHSAQMSTVT